MFQLGLWPIRGQASLWKVIVAVSLLPEEEEKSRDINTMTFQRGRPMSSQPTAQHKGHTYCFRYLKDYSLNVTIIPYDCYKLYPCTAQPRNIFYYQIMTHAQVDFELWYYNNTNPFELEIEEKPGARELELWTGRGVPENRHSLTQLQQAGRLLRKSGWCGFTVGSHWGNIIINNTFTFRLKSSDALGLDSSMGSDSVVLSINRNICK